MPHATKEQISRPWKRRHALLVLVVLSLVLAACGSNGDTDDDAAGTDGTSDEAAQEDGDAGDESAEGDEGIEGGGQTIVASVPALENEYFQLWDRGGSEAAEAFDSEWRMQSYDGDTATQINQMRSADAAGVDQVITFAINNDAVGEIAETLGADGIPLATSFSATPWMTPLEERFNGFYQTYNYPMEEAGTKALSEAVFNAIGGSGNVVYLTGPQGDRTSIFREAGFDAAVAEFPEITVLDKAVGGGAGPVGREAMQGLYSRYDNIDAVVAHNSSSALGAVSVLEEAGDTHVKVGGTDESRQMLNKLVEGPNVVAVQSIFGDWLAGYLVARNYDLLQGVEFDPVDHMIYQDSLVIDTKEAAEAYLEVLTADESGFDWTKMSRALNPDDWTTQIAVTPIPPAEFFEELGTPRPPDYEFPADLQASLDAGNLEKIAAMYEDHIGAAANPYAEAIRLTTSGETVMGVKP